MAVLGVNVAIFRRGKILLTQREDFEVWCLPGGHVDPGESIAQAAIREAHEEVGLTVDILRLVGIYSLLPAVEALVNHLILFTAKPIAGSLSLQAEEVLAADYFSPNALPELLLWGHQQRIADTFDKTPAAVTRTQTITWPFSSNLTRKELYGLRDQSGLSRQVFYQQNFGK